MRVTTANWASLNADQPIPLLTRRLIRGQMVMVARVTLQPGCHVLPHHHESEQIGVILSGRVQWTLGEPGEEEQIVLSAGDVIVVPPDVPHSVVALEETEIIDILSPPGPMGIDGQKGAH